MPNGKAPGEDGIPPEVYKYGGDELAAELTRLLTFSRSRGSSLTGKIVWR